MNVCEQCKKEFQAKTKNQVFCTEPCRRARYILYARAYGRDYRKANAEKVKAKNAAYCKANAEKANARAKAYYKANAEKVKAKNAARYDANPISYKRNKPQSLEARRKAKRRYVARAKARAESAAYLADPANAAKVAEANARRLTLEDKEKLRQKAEQLQEKAERRAQREALRKARQVTPQEIEKGFVGVFDLEWAPSYQHSAEVKK